MSDLGARTGRALGWRATHYVGAKLIFLVRLLVLARILGPTAFGLLAIAQTAIGVMSQLTDIGMVPALVQKPTLERRHYDAAWTVNLIRGIVITVAVIAAAPVVAALFAAPEATEIVRVLALSPLLLAGSSIRLADLHRGLDFRSLAVMNLGQASTNTVVAIALAGSLGVWALVVGALVGSGTHLVLSYFLAPHRPRLVFRAAAIRPLVDFGRWILLAGVLAMAGHFILQAVISRQLGVAELGLYYMATQIAFLPVDFATDVGGSVAFPLFSRLQENARKAARAFRSLVVGLSGFLVPVCALLIALAPPLVDHVLGDRWLGTAPVIRVLALVSLGGIVGEAAIPLLKGLGRPSRLAVLEAVQAIILVASVWTLAGWHGLTGAAAAWIPATLGFHIVSVIYVRRMVGQPFLGVVRPVAAIGVASLAGGLLAWFVSLAIGGLAGFAAGTVAGGAVILVLLWLADRRLEGALTGVLLELLPRTGPVGGWLRALSKGRFVTSGSEGVDGAL